MNDAERNHAMVQLRPLVVKALQKTRLNRVAHRVYYSYVHGFNTASPGLLPAMERCFELAGEWNTAVQGDYCEFGIFKGYSFWYAQQLARRRRFDRMRFFGFDSFAGLPEVDGVDRTRDGDFYRGQYACSKEQVIRNLDSKGVDWNRTFLVEGFFEQTLNERTCRELGVERVSIALIDCDLYASTVCVLNFIRDLLTQRTIVLFDDWNCFDRDDNRGQRRALREFLEENPGLTAEPLFEYGVYGKVFALGATAPPQVVVKE